MRYVAVALALLVLAVAGTKAFVPLANGDPVPITPPPPSDVGFNSALPEPGKSFMGIIVANRGTANGLGLEFAECSARLHGHRLATRTVYFYSASGEAQAVSCAWQIPKGATGTLFVSEDDSSGYQTTHAWPVG